MTKSQDRLPMGSPLTPRRVITSRFASRSRVFPLCRRLEDTGYFTGPPYSIQICNASIAQHFILSRKSVDSSALPQVRGGEGAEPVGTREGMMGRYHQARMVIPGLGCFEETSGRESEKSYSCSDLGGFHILILFKDSDRRVFAEYGILGDQNFFNLLLRRRIIHHVQHHIFEDGTQASSAGFLEKRFPCDRAERAFRELELHLLKGEQFFILLGERVSRFGQDSD